MNGDGEVFLPNVSYVVENNRVYYTPFIPNYFTGIVNVIDTTTSYQLFSGGTVGMDNIKTMKINDIEVTPVSASTFNAIGNNNYFVDLKNPLTSTQRMFQNCSGLTSLDLSNFDTINVTDMGWMFNRCLGLTEVRMGGNPINVSEVSYMFSNITTTGTFYYNNAYDYSKIIGVLPSTWTAVACTLTDGVLIPNE